MDILFRCDAGSVRGSGHVVRCLTLAAALAERGARAVFLCREDAGPFLDLVRDKGFTLHVLPAPAHTPDKAEEIWDEEEQRADFELCRAAVAGRRFGRIIVDHYGLGAAWETPARALGDKIVVIDDLANRPHDCDILLDQNEYIGKEGRYGGLLPAGCEILLGGQYALLRPEFAAMREKTAAKDIVRNILVFMGGTDFRSLSLRLARILGPLATMEGINVDIVVGRQNPDLATLGREAANNPSLEIHAGHGNMAALMAEADIAFGAGGTATWEFCCLGVPLLMITFADNQVRMARDCEKQGVARYIGHFDAIDDKAIAAAFESLAADSAARRRMRENAMRLIDGRGAARAAALILSGGAAMTMRRAEEGDCRDLLEWRNDPLSRAMSLDRGAVSFDDHRTWFERSLRDPARVILIGERDGAKIGMVRYDPDGAGDAAVSVNLNPAWRGRGLAAALLAQSEQELPGGVKRLTALVRRENIPSLRLFESAGYILELENDGTRRYFKLVTPKARP
jgi:UDP-2,4-diacetamido-2,4,6-trideoxy-beta-L-altropyranose hydrolase